MKQKLKELEEEAAKLRNTQVSYAAKTAIKQVAYRVQGAPPWHLNSAKHACSQSACR